MHKFLAKKLKTIRLLDVLLLLILVPVIIFAVFYFRREKQYVYVDLTYSRTGWNNYLEPPEYWKVNDIETNDIVYNSLGTEIATVTDVEKNIWGGGSRNTIELQLRMKVIFDTRTKKYVMDGVPLLIGDKMVVYLGDNKFEGEIKNIYLNQDDRYEGYTKKRAFLTLKYRNIEAWHAESLNNFVQLNSNGEVIAKVLSLDIKPSELMLVTDDGRAVPGLHTYRKDVDLKVELPRVLCKENTCFYNNYNAFLVGSSFWADSGSVIISEASIVDVVLEESDWQ